MESLSAQERALCGATIDSRLVKPGMLFCALPGEHTDGARFIPAARAKGATVIAQGLDELQDYARRRRAALRATVIGVTGSAGKTTVKELTAAFLRAGGYKVSATEGNYNNHIGVPLTLLNTPLDADFLVVEMGTNHPGEIEALAKLARPHVGLISSIGNAHIEFFGSQEAIAHEKGALLRNLVGGAHAFGVWARDNPCAKQLAQDCAQEGVTVALDDALAARLAPVVCACLPGAHNLTNALIACACAMRLGVTFDACVRALDHFSLPGARWRVTVRGGVTYIDDSYNANPASMCAALQTFAKHPTVGRRLAVLGEMLELGAQSAAFHKQVKACAEACHLDGVIYVGEAFQGMSLEEAQCELQAWVRAGDCVLLKASHRFHLSQLIPEDKP